ncbi:hypothetical protein R0135_05725 [Congregibacter variabilis]|uniref:Uncharacterized protein n=1 Tax=Congregibacter variabilis TaxID=3081200 RepID=A0ABZ0I565_9GAMM|nr:hypothetical protein R0135_05725 [Congregibacter sp. IMCC43200]
MSITVWGSAFMLYLLFKLWYDGFRQPLSQSDVERFLQMATARAEKDGQTPNLEGLRKFLEEDDGREFIMVNLLQFNATPISDPDTGEASTGPILLRKYFKPFMGRILRRAGHPVIAGQVKGGYLDEWNTPPNPGWHAAGLVRYRSRRDAMELSLANTDFDELHKYKVAALAQTFAIPTHRQMGFYASPRVSVALILALAAALLQLALV